MAHMGDPNVNQLKPSLGDEKVEMIAATTVLQTSVREIRSSEMDWEEKLKSQNIAHRDFMAKLDRGGYKDVPEQNPDLCCNAFVNLLNSTSLDNLTMQYLLIMLDDILTEDRSRVKIFRERKCGNIWKPLLKLLNSQDPSVQHLSAGIIAKLACWHPKPMAKDDLHKYLSWLVEQLKSDDTNYIHSVLRCLQMMLRIDVYRFAFLSYDGLYILMSILDSGVNFQIQYQVIFCLWVLTFNPLVAASMKSNVIPILADILTETRKEKVSRIVLAVFRNLIEKPKDPQVSKDHCITMLHCKVLKQLSILEQKRSDDEDIMNDVDFLNERLHTSMQYLSSFDQYATEVKSGHLKWSPVHKSAKFWRENAARLNERGSDLVRKLVHLLKTSTDPVVLAVGCYDIGEYVRHYPRGKHIVEELGGKQRVMLLLNHDDPSVRYEALLAVQKIMVHNWYVL